MTERPTNDSMIRSALIGLVLAAWFAAPAPAQPPDFWAHLSAELDADQDGVITREEFDQGASRFPHLDHNGDGVLTEDDFAGGPGFGDPEQGRPGAPFPADADGDGAVTAEEWQAHFEQLDVDGDGTLSSAELPRFHDLRPGHGPSFGKAGRPGHEAFAGMLLAHAADGDRDGEVAAAEWRSFVDSLAPDAGGVIAAESLAAALPPPPGRHGARGDDRAEHLSRLFDQDGDGFLEVEDLDAMFAALDQDGDGALTAAELPRHHPHRHGGPPVR